jgi:hexosaminidase
MRKITILIPVFLLSVLVYGQPKTSIIPQPVNIIMTEGNFLIEAGTSINFNKNSNELKSAAAFLSSHIKDISGYTLPLNGKDKKAIELKIEKNQILGEEGYTLHVTPKSIKLSANTRAGIVYGLQTLFQTLPVIRTNAALEVPGMNVTDYPRFQYRGMHLDVSRHFFSPETVKEYINLMGVYKFNTFHWHLTDDQGWRIEIKKYPLLTSVGAWRVDRTDKPWDSRERAQPGEEATYGGFYTQEQIKDIVAYAKERNITIIPEIEMPGHAEAAIASYPFLSCTKNKQFVITGGQYPKEYQTNYCAGNDSIFVFLENVLTEVMQLFPSKYIHIGGDEVDKSSWKTCPKCQERMQANNLKNVDELQSYFIRRMEKFLVAHKRKLLGWDEILEGGLAPEATVMSWRGETGGIEAAKMGHDVVMTPGNPLYFDQYQAGSAGEPLAIGGFNTLKMVYNYNPIPKELNDQQAKHVLGAQANLWAEFITTPAQIEYMVLPRMLALSEVLWSKPDSKNWIDFNERLKKHFTGFDQKGYNFSRGNYTVMIKPLSENGKLTVDLSSDIPDAPIYYTMDGSDPTTLSKRYTTPLVIDSSVLLKVSMSINGQIAGKMPAQQAFTMHKAVGRNVNYVNPPSKFYLADGPNSLTDGVRGTSTVTKYWHGFNGKDLIATIDLGKVTGINKLSLGCLQHYKDWIFFPENVTFELSIDGKNFTTAGTVTNTVSPTEQGSIIKDFSIKIPEQQARYVRVKAKILPTNPKDHPGEGLPTWLFADEIVVE